MGGLGGLAKCHADLTRPWDTKSVSQVAQKAHPKSLEIYATFSSLFGPILEAIFLSTPQKVSFENVDFALGILPKWTSFLPKLSAKK